MKIFLFLVVLMWGGTATAQTAVVTDVARVNMRSGKAENYRTIRVLPPGAEVQVIEADRDYAKVKAADGETGWVLLKLLTIRKADAENTAQHQAALEAAQKELIAARVELANLQRQMERTHDRPESGATSFLLLSAFGAFACGAVIGALILRAYYQKRLHGLRI